MKCYGTQYRKLKGCKSCDLAEWCKDAADPPLRPGVQGAVEIDEMEAPEPTNQRGDLEGVFAELFAQIDCKHQSRPMLRFLRAVLDHAIDYPKTMSVAMSKIVNPHMSYSMIGDELGLSKQMVAFHLAKAKEMIPGIDNAILVDSRWKGKHVANLTLSQKCAMSEANEIKSAMLQVSVLRQSNRISQRYLSKRCKISDMTLCRWETGKVTPTVDQAKTVLHVLEECIAAKEIEMRKNAGR